LAQKHANQLAAEQKALRAKQEAKKDWRRYWIRYRIR
jgi:hypothetical protein